MSDYEQLRQVRPQAAVVVAANPSPMTLQGTNTWLLRDDPTRRQAIVVDPGPLLELHLDAVLAAAGTVSLIVLTHRHPDHAESASRVHGLTGAPVLALDPDYRLGSEGLTEGQSIEAAGVHLRVWATPGHTSDSLSLVLEDDAVLTGDTVLGSGTTVVAHPDGVLADYLTSLGRLATLDGLAVLPGHGPELPDAGQVARHYLAHRQQRLEQVRAVLATLDTEVLGPAATAAAVLAQVYADVDRALWPAAELSVQAQLRYLAED